MNPKQAYAGQLPVEPMVIPRNAVLMVYSPDGAVQSNAIPRNGMANWVVDFTELGPGSKLLIDGKIWGLCFATGTGTLNYVYLPRDLAAGIDFASPVIGKGIAAPRVAAISGNLAGPIGTNPIEINNNWVDEEVTTYVPDGWVFVLTRLTIAGSDPISPSTVSLAIGNHDIVESNPPTILSGTTTSGSPLYIDQFEQTGTATQTTNVVAPDGITLFPGGELILTVSGKAAVVQFEGYYTPLWR
jgi:hypothetical protein